MDNQISLAHEYELKPLIYLIGMVLLVILVALILSTKDTRRDHSVPTKTASHPFPVLSLEAKAVYVYDIRAGKVLFARNEDKRLPLASLTKIMSAVVAEESLPESLAVKVDAEALREDGDSELLRDERWNFKNLLNFSLVTSSNDGIKAVALAFGAASDFVSAMNEKASKLGLKNTYFWNETGLDESDVKGGAYGSARDFTRLMSYAWESYPEIFSGTREQVATFTSLDNKIHTAKNTNDIVGDIPGLLASKTGYTSTAGGNLSIIFDPELGYPIAITVLGSSEEGRFRDMEKLVSASIQYLSGK
ncbi:MAG: D-alanyl-D-alanine carboxypeptidase [Candidatus Zambryskibacteria bacterium]|nr:D-alanyl-D-alanine carboxypeptidase [Candidatus Zambryskibacteria bacterium]